MYYFIISFIEEFLRNNEHEYILLYFILKNLNWISSKKSYIYAFRKFENFNSNF